MTDSPATMHRHVALNLRLVYESTGSVADPHAFATGAFDRAKGGNAAHGWQVGSSQAGSSQAGSSQAGPSQAVPSYQAGSGTDVPGWRLVGLLPADIPDLTAAANEPGAAGSFRHDSCRFVTEAVTLTLDRDEAEGYYLNLTSPEPSLFALIWLPDVASATAARRTDGVPEAEAVTASYSEASRWMDGGMVVIRTELPEPMLAWIAEFAQHHYQVEGKKPRSKFRPSFLSRREFGEVTRAEQASGRAPSGPARDGRRTDDAQPQPTAPGRDRSRDVPEAVGCNDTIATERILADTIPTGATPTIARGH